MTTRRDGSATPRIASALRLLFVAVGLVSLVLGYVGLDRYLHVPGSHPQTYSHAPNDLVYFDLQLFLLQSTPLAFGGPYPWQLSVARFSAPSVALYAVAEVVVAVSARRVHRTWLRRSRGHAVVFGTTRTASVVVARLRTRGVRVLVVRPDNAAESPVGFDTAADDRWTVVGGTASRRPGASRTGGLAAAAGGSAREGPRPPRVAERHGSGGRASGGARQRSPVVHPRVAGVCRHPGPRVPATRPRGRSVVRSGACTASESPATGSSTIRRPD